MRELNVNEVNEVSGGIIPFIIAVVAFDFGLIGSMFVVQSALGGKK